MTSALIIVDVQYDFLPGGALAVPSGDEIIPVVLQHISDHKLIATTADWHPENHISFSDEPKFVDKSWPPHCVQGTIGARLHEHIVTGICASSAQWRHFKKGTDPQLEAYSGFDGAETETGESLEKWLRDNRVDRVEIVGLATDYCVKATALDANSLGFWTSVELPAVRGVSDSTTQAALDDMVAAGVYLDY